MKQYFGDLLLFLGAAALVYGVSLIYAPAAWIVGGIVLMAISMLVEVGMPGERVKPVERGQG